MKSRQSAMSMFRAANKELLHDDDEHWSEPYGFYRSEHSYSVITGYKRMRTYATRQLRKEELTNKPKCETIAK